MNPLINKKTIIQHLGLVDYQEAWGYQAKLFNETIQQKISNRNFSKEEQKPTPNYLLFCQHPHVYTLGKSGDEKNLLLNEQGLKERSASFYRINRGGDITYHGPGQLVGYPILDLDNFFTDIHKYLRLMEQAVINTLEHYDIKSGRVEGLTGVWLEGDKPDKARKICAIGVKTSRWVTMHGFAFNINSNLDYFKHIVPCGISDKAVTSLQQELGIPVDFEEAKKIVKEELVKLFEMEVTHEERY